MTYGLVYRYPAHQVSTASAGESTILSSAIAPPQAPAEEVIKNETKIVQQTQYTHQVSTTANHNVSNPQRSSVGSTTNKYGIRSRGHPAAKSTPLIYHLSPAFETMEGTAASQTLPTLSPSVDGMNHGHQLSQLVTGMNHGHQLSPSVAGMNHGHQYEVEEIARAGNNVVRGKVNDDTEAEG